MHTGTHGKGVALARAKRMRGAAGPLAAAAAALALAGCGPSPEDPAEGELTAVIVSRNDHPMPFGGGVVDSWSHVLVLTREELIATYESSWPGRDAPADHDIPRVGVKVEIADLPPDNLAEVSEGRFRIPWPEGGRYLCLGDEYQGIVTTAGCVLVDAEAPVKVTLESSIGGFRIKR